MNENIKTIPTFKSGNFVFSAKYNQEDIKKIEFNILLSFGTIKQIPILPDLTSKLEEELIKKSIFGTASIEGNNLSQENVNKILEGNKKTEFNEETKNKLQKNFIQEITNLKQAYTYVKQMQISDKPLQLNEEIIKKIHQMITINLDNKDNIPGVYRNHIVKVGDEQHGGINTPPKILDDVKNLMKEFILWINSEEITKNIDPMIRACMAHYYLALIHPFGDGNGRTCRLVEAMMLKSYGFKFVYTMLSNYYYKNLDEYFLVFSQTRKNNDNDITPFVKFYLMGLLESINTIKNRIYDSIRYLSLNKYYLDLKKEKAISLRQYDFLTIMLETSKSVTIKEILEDNQLKIIYRSLSVRTLQRELKDLLKQKLLMLDNKTQKYTINIYVL
jgi:Fic family protein